VEKGEGREVKNNPPIHTSENEKEFIIPLEKRIEGEDEKKT